MPTLATRLSAHVIPQHAENADAVEGEIVEDDEEEEGEEEEDEIEEATEEVSDEEPTQHTARKIPQEPPRTPTPKTPRRKPRKPKKKGITFKKTVGVHTIPNIDTYRPGEKEAQWFTPDEYGGMEDECDLTSEMMNCRRPLWPISDYVGRGLEAWTTEGEQRKEGHVQLAIDIVWQGQLEQWKASSDINECWEFIRVRYVQVSRPCHKLAHKVGLKDEEEVQSYLAGVRSVDKNRRRMLGIRSADPKDRKVRRTASEYTPKSGSNPQQLGRNHSQGSPKGAYSTSTLKGIIKITANPFDDEEDAHNRKTPISGSKKSLSKKKKGGYDTDEDASIVSELSKLSQASRASQRSQKSKKLGRTGKISFQPKSRAKVPVSPVASLCTEADSDDTSTARRMRSHMSVCSEDSTRRRMLRTASIKGL
jgi:hypothetical protein